MAEAKTGCAQDQRCEKGQRDEQKLFLAHNLGGAPSVYINISAPLCHIRCGSMARIMVVDDTPDVILLERGILERAGHEVIEASSGAEALEKLRSARPDLILLDIMMPGMDGWETLRRIRKLKGFEEVPVAMLTAKPMTPETAAREDIEELLDYIQFPFTIEGLTNKVNTILERLRDIDEKEARSGQAIDEGLIKQYRRIAEKEFLHKSILDTLKKNLEDSSRGLDPELAREAISLEQERVERLKKRRGEILRKIIKG
ncbi:MAG: response regulator [Methanobacteriota archaeon]|nr:MAG: response regulator [Euryarchaeota archaeon]